MILQQATPRLPELTSPGAELSCRIEGAPRRWPECARCLRGLPVPLVATVQASGPAPTFLAITRNHHPRESTKLCPRTKKSKLEKPFLATHPLSLFHCSTVSFRFLDAVFFSQLYIFKMWPQRNNVYHPYFFLKHEEKRKVSRIHAFSKVITRSLSWCGRVLPWTLVISQFPPGAERSLPVMEPQAEGLAPRAQRQRSGHVRSVSNGEGGRPRCSLSVQKRRKRVQVRGACKSLC